MGERTTQTRMYIYIDVFFAGEFVLMLNDFLRTFLEIEVDISEREKKPKWVTANETKQKKKRKKENK